MGKTHHPPRLPPVSAQDAVEGRAALLVFGGTTNLGFDHFYSVSALKTAQNPKFFLARFARRV